MHDAVSAVELALAEAEALLGHPLIDDCEVNESTGEILPDLTIVTDNGGPFRSFTFEAFIAAHPEVRHVRTRVRAPGRLEPARSRLRRHRRPHHPQLRNRRNSANYLTRDTDAHSHRLIVELDGILYASGPSGR